MHDRCMGVTCAFVCLMSGHPEMFWDVSSCLGLIWIGIWAIDGKFWAIHSAAQLQPAGEERCPDITF